MQKDYLERIYAGFLAKAMGVRLGAPVEPLIWTREKIETVFGNIDQYVQDYTNFAADDDTNGPIYFIRALRNVNKAQELNAQHVGQTWLNYIAEGHGMLWWGGYGVSTEHTAWLNLFNNIDAPLSGSIQQNGIACAEQIGGQIFIDSWGWVSPGNIQQAAQLAQKAAAVSHDGEGIYGGMFVAACVAAAFTEKTMEDVFKAGLSVIPSDCEYHRVATAVYDVYKQDTKDWKRAMKMLEDDFGYNRYPGICHMIPNGGVVVLSILYGAGDISKTIEIATMCGWDTDCNAGNAGAIVGTFAGIDGIEDKYRKPINDFILASGILGTVNILDIPSFCKELAAYGYKLAEKEVPKAYQESLEYHGINFDFNLKGSLHGMRKYSPDLYLNWKEHEDDNNKGMLEVVINRALREGGGKVYYKPFYRQSDFDDERYRPMFTPLINNGQTLRMRVKSECWGGEEKLRMMPYVRRSPSNSIEEIGDWRIIANDEQWHDIEFSIPQSSDEVIDEIGFELSYFGRMKYTGRLLIDSFSVSGNAHYRINPKLELNEWSGVSRFTWNRGCWKLEDGLIKGMGAKDGEIWTGHAYSRNPRIKANFTPCAGKSHMLSICGQGIYQHYAAGFTNENTLAIIRQDFDGTHVLAEQNFELQLGKSYEMDFSYENGKLVLNLENTTLTAHDNTYAYGMCGFKMYDTGRVEIANIEIWEHE